MRHHCMVILVFFGVSKTVFADHTKRVKNE